jgi:hypothetical protein
MLSGKCFRPTDQVTVSSARLSASPGMRREGGLRGGSIAEPQAFEAARSPQAAAEGRWFPDVGIHLFEVRQLLLTRAQERRRIRHHPYVAMAEHCRHPEAGGFAYYAARYSWQTPKLRHTRRLSP